MKAILALEDGTYFEGESFGAAGEVTGELVFNTSMTGYQEVMTDPSYRGQIVTMTYPLIGNYGINDEDNESDEPQVSGFVVRESCNYPSNWRCQKTDEEFLKENNVIGIQNIDTRALTKHIRNQGMMQAVISTEDLNPNSLVQKAKESSLSSELVQEVTVGESYFLQADFQSKYHIAVLDLGVKENMLDSFKQCNADLTVLPADTTAEEILELNPDGLFISNGPGDPKDNPEVIAEVEKLVGKLPLFGICFGHQILALALGADTYKLKFGHRGANHPVKNLSTGQVYITSQNHGYAVKEESLPEEMIVTHKNLNDDTVEGMKHTKLPIFSVQYHPEAAPGPHDSDFLFNKFIELIVDSAA
ncbi:glutamine-hydrolyzing carbamoyl-phosphate synthase small subunit [Acetohalobium arabaticum]|uniref:Carbamoyl phosphate synthase small chain n=1 Tax=Acetohalobium arabaticum (strain ATCC 49924 / DSM 5501 / Z-7288) TaxID=574087 RepID=D9QRA0_ACEAZ|nr:glutamine-hydrolyzing carbamoyl-phosphate synthase small subunit [Acetohalobium arabaticum]ADL13041.1 carbamoyl-phosphate synthase small subunit [Acetohalobium arabaticum DSM 5501]